MSRQQPDQYTPGGFPFWISWYLVSLAVVLVVPSYLKLGHTVRQLPAVQVLQSLVLGLGFLAFVLALHLLAPRRPGLRRLAAVVGSAVLCFAVPSLLLLASRLQVSRAILLMSSAFGVALVALGGLAARSRVRWLVLVLLAAVATSLVLLDRSNISEPLNRIEYTEYYGLRLRLQRPAGLAAGATPRSGGAIAPLGDSFLLVTGAGRFYRLRWGPGRDSLLAEPLPLRAPLNLAEFLEDQANPATAAAFRITDLAVDENGDPPRVYVVHRYWNRAQRCVTTRVSMTALEAGAPASSTPPAWRTIFESTPCLSLDRSVPPVAPLEEGGAIALHPTRGVLLSLGDNGYDGLEGEQPFAQRADVSYGKILQLTPPHGAQILSMGHRNPQGLTVDAEGRIWEAEHGPQGGDEINLIKPGKNYGWPLATYGTQYGLSYWPLARGGQDQGDFEEPVQAFVPSLGISQLISVHGPGFPRWDGDLLAASLRRQSLYRVRLRGDRAIYVEAMYIGERIRDLAEGRDGRILLWTDHGQLVSVVPGPTVLSGRYVFQTRCAGCHEPAPGTNHAAGPDLHGVVRRPVAADAGFQYSASLRQLGGRWTTDRLLRFLENPGAYAPGTSMTMGGIAAADQRKALVEYLSDSYK